MAIFITNADMHYNTKMNVLKTCIFCVNANIK